jgi:hypothetical protein
MQERGKRDVNDTFAIPLGLFEGKPDVLKTEYAELPSRCAIKQD